MPTSALKFTPTTGPSRFGRRFDIDGQETGTITDRLSGPFPHSPMQYRRDRSDQPPVLYRNASADFLDRKSNAIAPGRPLAVGEVRTPLTLTVKTVRS